MPACNGLDRGSNFAPDRKGSRLILGLILSVKTTKEMINQLFSTLLVVHPLSDTLKLKGQQTLMTPRSVTIGNIVALNWAVKHGQKTQNMSE